MSYRAGPIKDRMKACEKLTVSSVRKRRELMKPPRIVSGSEEASFSLFISINERITVNSREE